VSRPLWRGYLKLSLVSCPIAVFNAITESEDIHLNFLNPETGNRIRYQVVDAETEELIDRADLVRGYQFQKDRYVTLTDDELDELKIESSEVMKVEEFVPFAEIPPMYFERGYYIVPDGEAGEEAYAVIREAMSRSGMFAITRAVIARKERVIALKPSGRGIVGHALREASDIRPEREFFGGIDAAKPDKDALAIALQLVEQKTARFDPAKFEDRYEVRLRQLIDAKLEGVELEPEEIEEAPKVTSLMEALKRSLAEGGKGARRGASNDDAGDEPRAATIHRLQPKKKAPAKKKPAKSRRRA
ncbi:MAG: non-homologous end joining protein Ku, partial [Ferrovibrionaceae bacterium]